jgi:hypothetical protein
LSRAGPLTAPPRSATAHVIGGVANSHQVKFL